MARILSIVFLILLFLFLPIVRADEYDDITKQLGDLKKSLNLSQSATQTNEKNLNALNSQLAGIKNRVALLEQELVKKEKEVKDGEKELAKQKDVLEARTVSYYKNLGKNPFGLVNLIVTDDFSKSFRNFFYYRSLIDDDRKQIIKIVYYINALEDKKSLIESETAKLTTIKDEVNKQSVFLAGEITKSKQYEDTLASQIAQLSARQQQLLAQKLADLHIPQSAYAGLGSGCSSDLANGKDPGFSPRIGFFTYGVPNRVGLNQYGAKGRAESGQNAQQILQAYYSADYSTGHDQGTSIHVSGTNDYGQSFDDSWSIEDYLKHLYEIPANWPSEALKAQAIAARSYALAYTNNGQNPICPSQSCQVVKREENSDAWNQAVSDTAGIVLTSGGQPIKAWFSSTHGGYVHSSGDIGWSDTGYTKNASDANGSVNNFSDLQNNAYDKASPWFYCDWGARSDYSGTAWLKSDEVADIANVIDLSRRDSNTNKHLYQVDKPNPEGTDTWDHERVKQELRSRGGSPLNSANDVNVSWDTGSGKTTSISISGDGGSLSFSASEFKSFFNLRAPANIQIVGPLYNVEKR